MAMTPKEFSDVYIGHFDIPKVKFPTPEERYMDCLLTDHHFKHEQDIFKVSVSQNNRQRGINSTAVQVNEQLQRQAAQQRRDNDAINSLVNIHNMNEDPYNNDPLVNYRMICVRCGCYYIEQVNPWDQGPTAGPYINNPIHRGPEGRMHEYWYQLTIQEELKNRMLYATNSRIFISQDKELTNEETNLKLLMETLRPITMK